MSTPNTFLRVIEVHKAIKKGDVVTASVIAERFEISQRQAQRVIEFLRDRLLAPVVYDKQRRTFIYTDPTFELPSVLMTRGEAIAILFAYQALLDGRDLPLANELAQGINKLQEYFPADVSVDLSTMLERVSYVPEPSRPVDADRLDALRNAMEQRRTVRIQYYAPSRDEVSERLIDPYHLTLRRGDWYVVGWCHTRKDLRTFGVSRIRSMSTDGDRYEIARDFNPDTYFADALGVERGVACDRVVLDFAPREARWVREKVWHPDQRLTELPDGGVRLEMTVALGFELRQWILSYGSHVRVVAPDALARVIADEHAAAARLYSSEAARPS